MPLQVPVNFSDPEWEKIELLAQRFGMSTEDVVSALASKGIAYRVRRRTGKAPAKVYSYPGKGKR